MITVVGSFAVGLTLRSDVFPAAGETRLARDFDQGPGGKGSNQAVQAARMGAEVEFVAAVGKDAFADMALELYAAEGVGTRHLVGHSERNTGLGFIMLDDRGENRILLDPGANELLSPHDVAAAEPSIANSAVVATQLEIPAAAAAAAMAAGRRAGAFTLLNPAPARGLPPEVLAEVDVLTPNQGEARALAGLSSEEECSDDELCARLLDLGPAAIVLTLGPRGALLARGKELITIEPWPVEVVDSTGAGDAFSGTLATAAAEGAALEDAAEWAAAAGALACKKLGVVPSLPHREQLQEFMDEGR
ncbi:MAG TPA: ribokinase [Actinomycetota bacterium]|nr:ribokinase [Actinomycetota bacterium]